MPRHRRTEPTARRGAATALAALVVAVCAVSASALDLDLTFDAGASATPSFDPSGAQLQAIVSAAATYWEDYLEDAHTLNVTYYWDDLAGGTLAVHQNQATSGGKPTEALIRFDTQSDAVERLWFFDPTPHDHGEFDLTRSRVADLAVADRNAWFTGSPPGLLEVGYRGTAVAGAPADAISGFDLLSTAIHELGHAVGLTAAVAAGEYADGDYDVPPQFVGGATMGIVGDFHLEAEPALMCGGCGATGLRRLPTATDILAVATAAGWNQLDLPRQDYVGSQFSNWNDPANWLGNSVPDADDVARIHDRNVNLTDTQTVSEAIATGKANIILATTGHLIANDGVTLQQAGRLTGVGDVTGTATNVGGGVNPGHVGAIGTLTLHGDYTQLAGAHFDTEIDGQLDTADLLDVRGVAALDGRLSIRAIGSTEPQLGDVFDILTADAIVGRFDQTRISRTELGADAALAVLYVDAERDTVRLLATYHGDANGDGWVDVIDLDRLGRHWLAADAAWQEADFNYDGLVDVLDLDLLGDNWGRASAAPASPAVPEPAGAALLGVGLAALARRGRRA